MALGILHSKLGLPRDRPKVFTVVVYLRMFADDAPKEVEGAELCCPNREGVAGAEAAVAKLKAPPLDAAAIGFNTVFKVWHPPCPSLEKPENGSFFQVRYKFQKSIGLQLVMLHVQTRHVDL